MAVRIPFYSILCNRLYISSSAEELNRRYGTEKLSRSDLMFSRSDLLNKWLNIKDPVPMLSHTYRSSCGWGWSYPVWGIKMGPHLYVESVFARALENSSIPMDNGRIRVVCDEDRNFITSLWYWNRRGVIPVSEFEGRSSDGRWYRICSEDGGLINLGVIYSTHPFSAILLLTAPNKQFESMQFDCQPLIVSDSWLDVWLNPVVSCREVRHVLRPYEGRFEFTLDPP